MNKIGILTFHHELNYGAVLQCYALSTYLRKNNEVEVINYDIEKKVSIKEKILLYRKQHNFNQFIQTYLPLSKYVDQSNIEQTLNSYQMVCVGSDQVWAYDIIGASKKVYFLDYPLKNTIKVSYAASFGKDETLINNLAETKKYLDSFKSISIREKSASAILNENGINTVDSIDPTLLLTKEEYINNLKLTKNNQKYILVYMLEIDDELVNFAKQISEKLNLKIICFNRRNRFGDVGESRYYASPKDFVSLVYNAEYIITNSFHGTCFSIIFEKPFVSFLHKTKGVRQRNLLVKANLTDHIYDPEKSVDNYLKLTTNKNDELIHYIEQSKQYLDQLGK